MDLEPMENGDCRFGGALEVGEFYWEYCNTERPIFTLDGETEFFYWFGQPIYRILR